MLKHGKHVSAVLIATCMGIAAPSLADNPDRKNPVSGQEVVQMYLGKTWIWSKGGSHWGGGGEFTAIFNDSVGVGKWYATNRGSLCYEATWANPTTGNSDDLKRCWKHVRDSNGVLWKQDPETGDWYRPQNEFDERIRSGNSIRSEVQKRRRMVGL